MSLQKLNIELIKIIEKDLDSDTLTVNREDNYLTIENELCIIKAKVNDKLEYEVTFTLIGDPDVCIIKSRIADIAFDIKMIIIDYRDNLKKLS